MTQINPDMKTSVEQLTRHLSECPSSFLAEPRIGKHGEIHVEAVITDLLLDLGGAMLSQEERKWLLGAKPEDRNRLRLTLVIAWLCHDVWFRNQRRAAPLVWEWIKRDAAPLAALVAADLYVSDPDRREELVRMAIQALGERPDGETEHQAADRLQTLSSVERARVIQETLAQQERARKIREEMKRREAEEAAARYNRE
jgi:hypothetical protein